MNRWIRPTLDGHAYLQQGPHGATTECACGEWSTRTPMPALIPEWHGHLKAVAQPTRTNLGIAYLAWRWLLMVATQLLAIWLSFDQLLVAGRGQWSAASYLLLMAIVTWILWHEFRADYRKERDDK